MYCPNCGSNINDGIRFCTQCGTKLNVDQPNVVADAPKKIESTPGKMTKIQCELCGSTDIMKEEGFFVCQHCGCKYSLEEARKMMIEGKVDVSGSTVNIVAQKEITGLLNLAKEALKQSDINRCEELTNKAIQLNPDVPDGWLLKACCNSHDNKVYQEYLERAKSLEENSYKVFSEEECGQYQVYTITILISRCIQSTIAKTTLVLDNRETKEVMVDNSAVFKVLKGDHIVTGCMEIVGLGTKTFKETITLDSNVSYSTRYFGAFSFNVGLRKERN